eukprot:maker-scaffold_60-snap-gene-0.56-mRNA-1 protein AED:0.14 eAED:0.50 QI:0/0/0.5/1/0/0/2/150/69
MNKPPFHLITGEFYHIIRKRKDCKLGSRFDQINCNSSKTLQNKPKTSQYLLTSGTSKTSIFGINHLRHS